MKGFSKIRSVAPSPSLHGGGSGRGFYPIVRNFLSVIRRYRLAAILNVLGLSVAFAAFMVIMIQLDYDRSFDKCHQDYDKIFRMEISQETYVRAVICRPLAEHFFESSPHIVAGAMSCSGPYTTSFYMENDGVRNFYEENTLIVSPGYTDVFTFDMVEGSKDALETPGNVLIPLSMSQKLFGNKPAVGNRLGELTVGGVYRDFPPNTIVSNYIYEPLRDDENKQEWNNNNYNVYIRVDDPSQTSLVSGNFKRIMDDKTIFGGQEIRWFDDDTDTGVRLTALPDIHYVTDVGYDNTPKTSKQTLFILLAIALIIVVIASINFTNFSTALSPMRVKSVNTQKILGARRRTLRLSFILEAVFISLLSYMIAIVFVELFRGTSLARMVDVDLSVMAHPLIIGGTGLIALITGLLVGLYPAYYMTSISPAIVLSGSFGLSPKGKKMRNGLIGVQFVASFALIIGASFMYLQNDYMQHSSLGYDKDNVIVTNMISEISNSRDAFTNQLKAYPEIEDVTYAQSLLSSYDYYSGWGRKYREGSISFQCLIVDYNYLRVMGVEITDGRDFSLEDTRADRGAFIFNEAARKKYQLELGSMVENDGEIIGFMSDVKFASFRMMVEPMAFYVRGTQSGFAHIKLKAGADVRTAMSHIRSTLAGFDPEFRFNIRFYDEVLQKLYEKESLLGSLITLFSLIAIFISIVGVFGLVVFDSECRRKEIGIRKVLGSSTIGIITMFNKAYFRILLVCFAVAVPLAWYAVHRWLENFAYKTAMYWWVYLFAFVAVGMITACTVTFQNWRVANANPVKSLKIE